MPTLTLQQTLVTVECARCGLLFAVPKEYEERRREDHAAFYCPTGHHNTFTAKSGEELAREKAAALQRQLASTEATLVHTRDQRDAAEASARAHKGHATRLRKRAAHGVCPCCSRTFADLARHMAGQHPEFVAETAS